MLLFIYYFIYLLLISLAHELGFLEALTFHLYV